MTDWTAFAKEISLRAFRTKKFLKSLSTEHKNQILFELANSLLERSSEIIHENKKDMENGISRNLSNSLLDRLFLDEKRIQGIAKSVRDIAFLDDPVGKVVRGVTLPNGIELITKKVPIGVLLIIYESRPNVTIDVAALCLKSGNACILRGGKESIHSNKILAKIFHSVLEKNGVPQDSVVFIDRTEREILEPLLKLDLLIDIVIPRGGEGLSKTVTELSSIPVIKHDKGVVNAFVDESADRDSTIQVILNSKVQRPGVCNALENLFVHKNYPYINDLVQALLENGVEILDDRFEEEFLDLRLSFRKVESLDEAIEYINHYTSGHTELILSENFVNIQKFRDEVDSAAIYVNCSTRFHDGGQYGLGAEVGISTGKLHVRGPMGLEHLTTTTTYLTGRGHVRA